MPLSRRRAIAIGAGALVLLGAALAVAIASSDSLVSELTPREVPDPACGQRVQFERTNRAGERVQSATDPWQRVRNVWLGWRYDDKVPLRERLSFALSSWNTTPPDSALRYVSHDGGRSWSVSRFDNGKRWSDESHGPPMRPGAGP